VGLLGRDRGWQKPAITNRTIPMGLGISRSGFAAIIPSNANETRVVDPLGLIQTGEVLFLNSPWLNGSLTVIKGRMFYCPQQENLFCSRFESWKKSEKVG
jgi:hypothetical protein